MIYKSPKLKILQSKILNKSAIGNLKLKKIDVILQKILKIIKNIIKISVFS